MGGGALAPITAGIGGVVKAGGMRCKIVKVIQIGFSYFQ